MVIRRRLKRRYVLAFFQKLPSCLVGIEACASSHYWARELQALGHTVRLMPPTYVTSSRYKGVCKIHDRCWQASIRVDGRQIYLGRFGLETDAAIAYNYHAAYLHGEFASLNDLSDIAYMHD